MDEAKPGTTVKSLEVALDIVEAVAESREELGVSELSTRLSLTKGSVFRYLRTLTDRGYLRQNPATLRYGLGTRLHVLGELAAEASALLPVADPILRRLRDELSLTVNLAGARPDCVEILRSLVGTSMMEIGVRLGSRLPYGATSQGRIIMAFGRNSILRSLRRQTLARFTEFTVADLVGIERKVELARQHGWTDAPQEMIIGINGASVPVFDAEGDCIAATTLVGSIQFLGSPPSADQLAHLSDAGRAISAGLGYKGQYPDCVVP